MSYLLSTEMIVLEAKRQLENLGIKEADVQLVFDPLSGSAPDIPLLLVRYQDRFVQVQVKLDLRGTLGNFFKQSLAPAVHKCKELLAA